MKYEINGYNLDEFIRKLHKKKIEIFNLNKPNEKSLIFSSHDKNDVKIQKLIRNFQHKSSGSRLQLIKKAIINNISIILGLCVGLVFYLITRNYIWNIKIMGNSNLETSEIVGVLADNGITVGKINKFDSDYIEDILLNQYDMIAQASVIKRGTSIIINISEKLVYNDIKYAPIVARYAGVIRKIELTTGTLNVAVGDYVNAGDVLVFPYNLDSSGNQISVIPNARIEADMFITGVESVSKHDKVLVKTGKSCVAYVYKFRDFELFGGKGGNSFDIFSVEVYNEYISDILPLSRDVYVYHEEELINQEVNFAEVSEDLLEKSKLKAESNLPAGEIIDTKSHTEIIGDTLYAYTNITIYGEINANNQRTN